VTAGDAPVEVEIELETGPQWIEVFDLVHALPSGEGEALSRARGATALPVHDGDVWAVSKRLVVPGSRRSSEADD